MSNGRPNTNEANMNTATVVVETRTLADQKPPNGTQEVVGTNNKKLFCDDIDWEKAVNFDDVLQRLKLVTPDTGKFKTEINIYKEIGQTVKCGGPNGNRKKIYQQLKTPKGIAVLLNFMLDKGLYPNPWILNTIILTFRLNNYFEEAIKLFDVIINNKELVDHKTYEIMFNLFNLVLDDDRMDIAEKIYSDMAKAGTQLKLDAKTYCTFISKAINSGKIELAKSIYESGLKNCADKIILFTIAPANVNNVALPLEIFQLVNAAIDINDVIKELKEKAVNVSACKQSEDRMLEWSNVINKVIKTQIPYKTQILAFCIKNILAEDLYPSIGIFNNLRDYFNSINDSDSVKNLYRARNANITRSITRDINHDNKLKTAFQKKDFHDIKYYYTINNEVIFEGQSSTTLGNFLIKLATRNNDYEFAKQVYKDSIQHKLFDSHLCFNMIGAARRQNDLAFVKTVYEDAKKETICGGYVYLAMIGAALKNNDLELAMTFYSDAINHVLDNNFEINIDSFCCLTLEIAFKYRSIEFAKIIYDGVAHIPHALNNIPMLKALLSEHKNEQSTNSIIGSAMSKKILDLHGLGYYGSCYLLNEFIKRLPDICQFSVIYGKGNRTIGLESKEDRSCKAATNEIIDSLKKNYEIDLQYPNSGRVIIKIKGKKLIDSVAATTNTTATTTNTGTTTAKTIVTPHTAANTAAPVKTNTASKKSNAKRVHSTSTATAHPAPNLYNPVPYYYPDMPYMSPMPPAAPFSYNPVPYYYTGMSYMPPMPPVMPSFYQPVPSSRSSSDMSNSSTTQQSQVTSVPTTLFSTASSNRAPNVRNINQSRTASNKKGLSSDSTNQ